MWCPQAHVCRCCYKTWYPPDAKPGDPVYFETLFPIVIDGRILISAGSYVEGEITNAKRPGKVKDVGEIRLRLNKMILPNGYTVDFTAVPNNVGTGGNEGITSEGNVQSDTDVATDAGAVLKTTGISAAIGGISSDHSGDGAGLGAGVGAAVGLAMVLLTRGPEAILPRGTAMDVVLDRSVYLDASHVNFTDLGALFGSSGPGKPRTDAQQIAHLNDQEEVVCFSRLASVFATNG